MTTTPRQQIAAGILDQAAGLFARHGFQQTSVQAVADAVGLSKAGLLHHYPSKEALRDAVMAQARDVTERALQQVTLIDPGPVRDRRALEVLTDLAMAQPGTVAYLLGSATASGVEAPIVDSVDPAGHILGVFGTDDSDPERLVRVIGALAALAVLSLAAHRAGQSAQWRSYVIDTSYDALGHRAVRRPRTHQMES